MSARALFLKNAAKSATNESVLPDGSEVAKLLSDMLGKQCTARNGSPPRPFPPQPMVFAMFGRDGDPMCVVQTNVALAMRLGGALAMFPQGAVDEFVKKGEFDGMLLDATHEVFNVVSRWFENHPEGRLRLQGMEAPGHPSEVPVPDLKRAEKVCFDVQVEGYGMGKLLCFKTA